MSTVQNIYDRAATLPEAQQRQAVDFIEFLAAKYATESTDGKRNLSAQDIIRLPRDEERTIIMAEQAELLRRHFAENPDEVLPDA